MRKEGRISLGLAILFYLLCVSSSCSELNVKHRDKHVNEFPIFNHTLATILVEYASAVYMSDFVELFSWTCSRCAHLTRGFEIMDLVVDARHCLQAFVGVAKDLNAIVIAFRGTQEYSLQNWIENLSWKQLDLNYPGLPDAMVHHGFYSAYHNTTIRPAILNAVARAKKLYGVLDMMLTGHSMGGAMAAFCGLDLTVNHKVENVLVMTFGQPRIGNSAFASYYAELVPNTIRITHGHDIVPHLPPHFSHFPGSTYHHFPREVWLSKSGSESSVHQVEKVCDYSGEDPSCSCSVYGNSMPDHLVYYGVELMGTRWRSCGIVMDPRLDEFGKMDIQGNIVLSRDPTSSNLKFKKQTAVDWNEAENPAISLQR